MNVLYKGARLLKDMYNQLNPATLTGAIDVLVIENEKGELSASPFHVRFGKLGVLRAKEKLVNITINDEEVDLHMKLGDQGEAFFVAETDDEELPLRLLTSPLPSRPSSPYPNDTCNNSMHLPMREESIGKRKRRKRRKRRSITSIQDSNNDYSQSDSEDDAVNTCTSDLSNEAAIRRRSPPSEKLEREDINMNNVLEDVELTPYKRMCSVFSDSELPQDINEDVESLPDSPFSDSEATERSLHSPIGWDWGQLPEDKNCLVVPGKHFSKLSIEKEVRSRRAKKMVAEIPNEITATLKSTEQDKPSSSSDTTENCENINKEMKEDSKPQSELKEDSKPQSQVKHANNGLYLDEILDLDPNLADLYFLSKNKEDRVNEEKPSEHDNDAGNITQEEGGFCVSDAGMDSGTDCLISEEASDQANMNIIPLELSLCGGKIEDGKLIVEEENFHQKLVTYEQFSENPISIMNNSELVIRIGNKNYDWMTGGPLLLSLVIFRKPLSQECMERIVGMQMNKKMQSSAGRFWWWRRSSHRDSTGSTYSEQGSSKNKLKETEDMPDSPTQQSTDPESPHLKDIATPSKQKVTKSFSALPSVIPQKMRFEDKEESSSCEDEMMRYSDNKGHQLKRAQTVQNIYPLSNTLGKPMKKTTRLTSEQLKSLNLKPGPNEISFSVTSQYQGTSRCYATVYLWKCTDKLVVSDIDGTITKSDVFGQIFPVVGKDWTQGGVAQLYHNISKNGYKFIYLSSRAIGQAGMTKGYLNWINQQGVSLPAGPLFLSPTSLMQAFHREVIEKKPEKFKIQCLLDIIALFPSESENPFTAGFGNKSNDVCAYTAVGIPRNRIFTINHKGELKQEDLQMYTTTYSALGDIVDTFFPALEYGHCKETHGYSTFNYWRDNIPDFSEEMHNF